MGFFDLIKNMVSPSGECCGGGEHKKEEGGCCSEESHKHDDAGCCSDDTAKKEGECCGEEGCECCDDEDTTSPKGGCGCC